MSSNPYRFRAAIYDFQSAHQRAGLEEVLAHVRGRSNDLLSYDEVAQKLKLRARSDAGIKMIPLDAIVGSAGRYTDFTRTFLPRNTGRSAALGEGQSRLHGSRERPATHRGLPGG